LAFATPAFSATITVNTTADDVTPNDGSVSLREAISAINAGNNLGDPDIIAQNPTAFGTNDTIDFNISGTGEHRIAVGTDASATGIPLPTITRSVTINGTSQPGSSPNTLVNADNAETRVLLSGASAGLTASGLFLGSGSDTSTIKGLDVFGFGGGDISILSSLNTVAGNDLGFDLGGGPSFSPHGVLILDAANNVIGGTAPEARNLISGNFVDGVEILGIGLPPTGNTVQGNFIGTDSTGTKALGNGADAPAGAGGGVQLIGANNNTIGGTVAGARNVIAGNAVAGILDNGAQNNAIQGNFVGVGADGVTAVPNATGVWLMSPNAPAPAAQNNVIGGTQAGSGNLIEFNSGAGAIVSGATASGDEILGNSIFSNGGLGIDLGNDGVTPNSLGGPHTGPNKLQNFPVITVVTPGSSTTTVQGTLNSTPSTTFRLEFFSSTACDPSGFGQGQVFLGFTNVSTDGSGNASYSVPLGVVVPAGTSIAATATDPANDTSEFSRCFPPLPSKTTPTQTPTTQSTTQQPPSQPSNASVAITSAKAAKDGSITLTGTTTVAGKVSASGALGGKGSAAANKHGGKRHKTTPAMFGPASKTLAAGTFTLKLKPNSTALAQLRAGKKLKVILTVTLVPTSAGKSATTKTTLTDQLPRKKHH
jgi:CSLREA domain-containing protein